MSIQVANINLSAATVGQVGQVVSFKNMLPPPTIHQQMRPQDHAETVAHLLIFNETGCLLTLSMPESRQTKTVPAGRWVVMPIPPHETEVDYLVVGVATGLFSNLLADYFGPGEPVDDIGVLGNSPIGVSGTVSTSNIQSLKNDGQTPPVSIIESTPSDQGVSAESWNNDASGTEQILSANAQRIVRKNTRGNTGATKAAVQFGDSNDSSITTLYGSLQGGQPANVAAITGAGANSLDGGAITTDGSGNVTKVGKIFIQKDATSADQEALQIQNIAAGGHRWTANIKTGNSLDLVDNTTGGGLNLSGGTGAVLQGQGGNTLAFVGRVASSGATGEGFTTKTASGNIELDAVGPASTARGIQLAAIDASGVLHGGLLIEGNGVAHPTTDDATTKRQIATYLGTTDPSGRAGLTINEGDVWYNI